MKTNRRPQGQKRYDRHTSHVLDKGRHGSKGQQKPPRYNRSKDGAW